MQLKIFAHKTLIVSILYVNFKKRTEEMQFSAKNALRLCKLSYLCGKF